MDFSRWIIPAGNIVWTSRVTGSVGSSLCSMSGGLQVIDRQVSCGGPVVRQKNPTCSKAFLPVNQPASLVSVLVSGTASLRLQLLILMLTRIMLCDAQAQMMQRGSPSALASKG